MLSRRTVAAAIPSHIPCPRSCRHILSLRHQLLLGARSFRLTIQPRDRSVFRYVDPRSAQERKSDQSTERQVKQSHESTASDHTDAKTYRTYHAKGKSPRPEQPRPDQPKRVPKSTPTIASTDKRRAYTVLTATPHTTTLAELLDTIPVLGQFSGRVNTAVFTLLVTPSYAHSVRYESHLIEDTIKRLWSNSSVSRSGLFYGVSTLVAVVDRLPRPERQATGSTSGGVGSEGIALMVSVKALDVPDLFGDKNVLHRTKQHDVATSSQVAQSITFNIMSKQTYHASLVDEPGRFYPPSYSLQIPLANTIFQNGLPSTLINTRYQHNREDKTLNLIKVGSRSLKQQTIRMPFFSIEKDSDTNLSLDAPLVPLTEARRVVACMGNIVRRLSAGRLVSDEKDTILASQELEHSVSAFFTARGIPAQTVSVWALVVPKKVFAKSMSDVLYPRDLTSRWKASSHSLTGPDSSLTPLSLLQYGARLHKVLSGGGGWGKKAGLLSLDPDSSYTHASVQSDESSFFDDLDLDGGKQDSALRDIVSPGDMVQFYIATNAAMTNETHEEAADHSNRGDDEQSVIFGTIPSTVDTLTTATSAASTSKSSIELFPDHFGALSENGIALTVNSHDSANVKETEAINQTKIDVPFSRFSLWNSRSDATKPNLDAEIRESEEIASNMENLFERFEKDDNDPEDAQGRETGQKGLNLSPTKPLQTQSGMSPTQRL